MSKICRKWTVKDNSGANKRINKFTPRYNKVIALKSKIVPVNKIFYLQLWIF